jgi:hypothetical protein
MVVFQAKMIVLTSSHFGVRTNQMHRSRKRRQILLSKYPANVVFLDISNSTIDSLSVIRHLPRLRSILATNTLISDLKDVPLHPTLRSISIAESSLVQHRYFRIMLLCSLNLNLELIDGEIVTEEDRSFASEIAREAQIYFFQGYLLMSLDPPLLSLGAETITLTRQTNFGKSDARRLLVRQTAAFITDFQAKLQKIQTDSNVRRSPLLDRFYEEEGEALPRPSPSPGTRGRRREQEPRHSIRLTTSVRNMRQGAQNHL